MKSCDCSESGQGRVRKKFQEFQGPILQHDLGLRICKKYMYTDAVQSLCIPFTYAEVGKGDTNSTLSKLSKQFMTVYYILSNSIILKLLQA